MRLLFLLPVVAVFLLLLPGSHAALSGVQVPNASGYIVNLGYAPRTPLAGGPVLLSLGLVNRTTGAEAVLQDVWVRIALGDTVYFTGTLVPEAGHVLFRTTFPKPGDYSVLARFDGPDGTVHEEALTLPVAAGVPTHQVPPLVFGLFAIIFFDLVIVGVFSPCRKAKGKPPTQADRWYRRLAHWQCYLLLLVSLLLIGLLISLFALG